MCNGSNIKSIRSAISKKNPYYISSNRQRELHYKCVQYKSWKAELRNNDISDTHRLCLIRDIELIDKAIKLSGDGLERWLFIAITEDRSYVYLKTVLDIPCGQDAYYRVYHKFMYTLSNLLWKIQ